VDALLGAVSNELGGRVRWVKLDLVDSRDDLQLVSNSSIQIKGSNGVAPRTLQLGSFNNRSRFLMPKLLTPRFLILPVSINFCISRHVSKKSQSG
jgi:hypothetical protein